MSIGEYTNAAVADRLVRLLDGLGIERAVLVGHDFGAPATWTVALRHRSRVAGLVLLAVPYVPDQFARPTELYAAMARRHFLHLHYFQEPGVAERELDTRPREFLQRLFHALSGGYRYPDIWRHPRRKRLLRRPARARPAVDWLSEDELGHYARVFARTGFGGGLAWYRAYDANWESSAGDEDALLEVPTLFVAGANDPVITMAGPHALDRMKQTVPDLRGVHLLDGAGTPCRWNGLVRSTNCLCTSCRRCLPRRTERSANPRIHQRPSTPVLLCAGGHRCRRARIRNGARADRARGEWMFVGGSVRTDPVRLEVATAQDQYPWTGLPLPAQVPVVVPQPDDAAVAGTRRSGRGDGRRHRRGRG